MNIKKLLSLLLCFVMLWSIFTPSVLADDAHTTVYVTLSKHGELVTNSSGEYLACVPVTIEEEYPNLDTVFREFHALYHQKGEEAYSSYEGEYGTAIGMLWEDTSELFGYQINGGSENVYSLSHTVQNGDFVDVCIYQSLYPNTESYTRFDRYTSKKEVGEDILLNLSVAGYDENWNTVFSPCPDAEISVNGELTGNITDENGNVVISFDEEGTYVISASSKKTVSDSEVTAICAPAFIAKITKDNTEEILHTIAEKYSSNEILTDSNAYWFVSNLADYIKIYPESSDIISSDVKQSIVDNVADMCKSTEKPGDLAKGIITLRAMGYNAKKVYDKNGELIDIPQKLEEMTQSDFTEVTNVYTLPYVIIALGLNNEYCSEKTMELLVNHAAENKTDWMNTEFGTDALTPMLLALSPYAEANENVRSALKEGEEHLISLIDKNGMIGNAPSTALAIVALCAVGTNPKSIENNSNSLIDGLISQLNSSKDGFYPTENSFATEQGMRALNAYMLFKNGDRIYNFCDFPMEEAYSSTEPYATIIFETTPKNAKVTVEGNTATDNIFYLPSGIYTYKVSGSGYKTKEDKFTISDEEAKKFKTITIEVSLNKKSSGGSGGYYIKPDRNVTEEKNENIIKAPVILHDGKTFSDISESPNKTAIEDLASREIINGTDTGLYLPDNTITRAEFTAIIARALSLNTESKEIFSDVKENDWFFPYINAAYSKGIVRGISATEFNPYGIITKEEAAAMVARAAGICGMNTAVSEAQTKIILCRFADYTTISSWATETMAFCYEKGILDISELNTTPQKAVSRAEMAQMIYNMLKEAKLI